MKRLKILIMVLMIGTGLQAQFPTTDSIKKYTDKYIRNQAIDAFQNMRLNRVLKGLASQIDSSNARIIGGTRVVDSMYVPNDSTLRFVIKNTATGVTSTYTLPINASGGGAGSDTSLLNDYYVQIGDSILLWKDSTIKGSGTFVNPLGVDIGKITHVYNVADYGIYPNGSDYTALFNALLITVKNAGGGRIIFNTGQYLFSGKIVFPYVFTDPTLPEMKGIVIEGMAAGANGRVYVSNNGATRLNMTYTGSPAKIDTRGAGRLEISNIAFMNSNAATDSTAFIQTTNTSLYIHDCSFVGAGAGYTASITDGIILGGTSSVTDTAVNAGFQGYGTTIRDNFFDRMRRGVYGKIYANAVTIDNNTFWNASGGTVNNAAIEFRGDAANSCAGSNITNNLFELVGYKYGIKLMYSVGFTISGNRYYDRNGYNLWPVYLGTGTEYNEIAESFVEGLTASVYDSLATATTLPSANYIRSSLQGGKNIIPNDVDISGELYKRGSYGPRVYDNNKNSSYWVTVGAAANGPLVHYLAYKPASAAEEVLVSYDRPATAGLNVIFGYSATSYVKFKSAVGHMYFNVPVGKELWFGEAGLEKHYITGGKFYATTPIDYTSAVFTNQYTTQSLVRKQYVDSLVSTVGGGSQWVGTTNIYHNTGNVSVGTTSVSYPFAVVGAYNNGGTTVEIEPGSGAGFNNGLTIASALDAGIYANIINTSTSATGHSIMALGANTRTGGDAFINYNVAGGNTFSSGLDNSQNRYKIGLGNNMTNVTTGIALDTLGKLWYLSNLELNATTDTLAIPKWGQVLRQIAAGGGGSGTVTSVALTMPGVIFNSSVTGSPITTSGTLSPTLATQTANTVLAGPTSGGAATPTFRALVSADVPTLNQNTTGTAANVTGTVAIANGGTGQTSASNAFNALSPNTTLGDITYGSGTNTSTRLAGNTTTTKKFLTQTGNGTISAAPAWGTIATGDLPTGIPNANLANSSISWSTGGTGSAAISWAASPTALGGTATLQITKATGANTGVIDAIDYARAYSVQATLSNPTGTITIDQDLGGKNRWNLTGTGGRTLAFSHLRDGDACTIIINNTAGATITLTLPSNSNLIGTGSVSTITIPTGKSVISLVDYDATNYLFSLATY